jgi:hypothetical protein
MLININIGNMRKYGEEISFCILRILVILKIRGLFSLNISISSGDILFILGNNVPSVRNVTVIIRRYTANFLDNKI